MAEVISGLPVDDESLNLGVDTLAEKLDTTTLSDDSAHNVSTQSELIYNACKVQLRYFEFQAINPITGSSMKKMYHMERLKSKIHVLQL